MLINRLSEKISMTLDCGKKTIMTHLNIPIIIDNIIMLPRILYLNGVLMFYI